jgi:hypothetical protein
MQPPWMPAVSFTSKPCSSGLIQRSAMPTPASDLPVAMASSNWSVEPAKLTSSTSRPRCLKNPCLTATGTGAVQIAPAFHESLSGVSGPSAKASELDRLSEAPPSAVAPAAHAVLRNQARRDRLAGEVSSKDVMVCGSSSRYWFCAAGLKHPTSSFEPELREHFAT